MMNPLTKHPHDTLLHERNTSGLSYANVYTNLNPQEGVMQWVRRNAMDLNSRKTGEGVLLNSSKGEEAVNDFKKGIHYVARGWGERLRKYCRPFDFHSDVQAMMLSFIERKAAYYKINNPEDEEFNEVYKRFCFSFSDLRYNCKENIKEAIEKYLSFIRQKLVSINKELPHQQLERENQIWNFFEKILQRDLNLLDVPIACLADIAGYSEKPQVNTNLFYLRETNNEMVERLRTNLSWVLDYCKNELKPFAELPQDKTMNFSGELIKIIDEYIAFLPKLPTLYIEDFSQNEERVDLMGEFIKLNFQKFRGVKSCELVNDPINRCSSLVFDKDFKPSFMWHPITKVLEQRYQEIMKSKVSGSQLDPYANEENIKQLETAIQFHQTLARISQIYATYINMPFYNFLYTCGSLANTINTRSEAQRQELNRALQEMTKPKNEQPVEKISEKDEEQPAPVKRKNKKPQKPTAKKGGGRKKTSHKTKPPKKGKRASSQANRHQKPTTSAAKGKEKEHLSSKEDAKAQLLSQSTLVPKEESISFAQGEKEVEGAPISLQEGGKKLERESLFLLPFQELNFKLTKAIEALNKKENSQLKHHLRQAKLNLEDMVAAQKGYEAAEEQSSKLFYLLTMIQGSYFYLEQILHAQRVQNAPGDQRWGHGHNLNLIKNQAGLQLNNPLLNELSVALFWTRSTYEQLKGREKWDLPSCLLAITQFYEADNLKDPSLSKKIQKVKDYLISACQLSSELPIIQEMPSVSTAEEVGDRSPELFSHKVTVLPRKMEKLAERCTRLFAQVNPVFHPKLSQAINHLNVVKGILHELSKETIASDQFSALVRGLLFWENTALEELLQVLYGIQKGVDSQSHNLLDLYSEVFSEQSHLEDLDCLSQIKNLHNLSRYPFETKPPKDSSTGNNWDSPHQLILQAELLKERPDIAVGFELSKKDKHGTSLNYLKTYQATPEEILVRLLERHQKIYKMMKRILPSSEEVAV